MFANFGLELMCLEHVYVLSMWVCVHMPVCPHTICERSIPDKIR